jgi:OmpA-OmpF porin, OOP family
VPSLDLRNFRPSTDPQAILYLEPVSTPGPAHWNVGAWASYAQRLVELEDAEGETLLVPVRNQFSLDYTAGIGLGERLALGLSLPTVLYQEGDELPRSLGNGTLPTTSIGDLGLSAKAALLPPGAFGGLGFGALAELTLPTGNGASYVSESSATGGLRLLGELGLVALTLRASVGARVRGSEQDYAGERFGHDLPWGLGLSVRPQAFGLDDAGHWVWTLEGRGALALSEFASGPQSPATLGAGARYAFGDTALVLGAEAPLSDAVGAPLVRGVVAVVWAPRFYDIDSDGFEDESDDCPELAEDRDGFEDSDGCPDFDNDGDGVGDDEDKCAGELEDGDGHLDEDGCADPDNDADGILDEKDACANEAGPAAAKPDENGCPVKDRDLDGIPDATDKCPKKAEDLDTFEDGDGCPERDNDKDKVPDEEDVCPTEAGQPRSDPKLNGCPSPDKDGDTLEGDADKCPDQSETFDGKEDDDGCPEAKPGRALASFRKLGERQVLDLAQPITFDVKPGGTELSEKSKPVVRALAALLNSQPNTVLMIAVRPQNATPQAAQQALSSSFTVVHELRALTHRDEAAESIGWGAVQKVPGSQRGNVGFLVLSATAKPKVPPKPPGPKAKPGP